MNRNMAKHKVVFGIYNTRVGVEAAVDALKAAGFRNTDISVLMSEKVSTKEFATEKHTKAPEGLPKVLGPELSSEGLWGGW
jgi:hypothetical protein